MGKLRLRATISAGIVTATVGFACTAASPALAASPTQFCAIVGAPASGPNAASRILGEGCFPTRAAEGAFVQSTVGTAALSNPLAPLTSNLLGVAHNAVNSGGSEYDFYGGSPGTCTGGYYYSFANITWGPIRSEDNATLSGANCYDSYWHTGSNFNGSQWDCSTRFINGVPSQSCFSTMPGTPHSVRFRG